MGGGREQNQRLMTYDDQAIQYRPPFVAGKFFARRSPLHVWTDDERKAWLARREAKRKEKHEHESRSISEG